MNSNPIIFYTENLVTEISRDIIFLDFTIDQLIKEKESLSKNHLNLDLLFSSAYSYCRHLWFLARQLNCYYRLHSDLEGAQRILSFADTLLIEIKEREGKLHKIEREEVIWAKSR